MRVCLATAVEDNVYIYIEGILYFAESKGIQGMS